MFLYYLVNPTPSANFGGASSVSIDTNNLDELMVSVLHYVGVKVRLSASLYLCLSVCVCESVFLFLVFVVVHLIVLLLSLCFSFCCAVL
jgi:hypothetical protein